MRFQWVSGADKIPREVFRCRYLVRFRRVPVKIPAEAPEGFVWFRRVPVLRPCDVPEGSGADTL